MKQAFVRAAWGRCIDDKGIRNGKLYKDIINLRKCIYQHPFVVYVYGTENFEYLKSFGMDCKLVSPEPFLWDMSRMLFRHKLDVYKRAMEDYDEVVFLDWDCRPTAPMPVDFWDIMRKKESFQANLIQYKNCKCYWRKIDWRIICNGGFVYMRDKSLPDIFIKYWEEWLKIIEEKGHGWGEQNPSLIFDDEPAMTKYVDEFWGEWKGIDAYWDAFEPETCSPRRKSVYPRARLDTKKACFQHW